MDQFEIVPLTLGTVLHRPGETIRRLYFPLDSMISITVTMAEGKTIEAGAVGNREVVGINAFMGGSETTQTEYIVQVAGDALRIEAEPLLRAFDENKAVRDVLLKYTQAMVAQLRASAMKFCKTSMTAYSAPSMPRGFGRDQVRYTTSIATYKTSSHPGDGLIARLQPSHTYPTV